MDPLEQPLAGRRVVVTRTREQASELAEKLRQLGAEAIELPVLKITKEIVKESLADVMLELGSYDWLVFTSANGVRYFFEEFLRIFDDIRSSGASGSRRWATGPARRIGELHLRIECQPEKATAAALADALIATGSLDNAKVLVITGNLNRDTLVTKLEEARAIVDQLQVYRTEPVDLARLRRGGGFSRQGRRRHPLRQLLLGRVVRRPGRGGQTRRRGGQAAGRQHRAPDQRRHESRRHPGRFRGRHPGPGRTDRGAGEKDRPEMKVPFLDLSLQHKALRAEALAALAATYDATRFCLGKDVEDFERNFGAALNYPHVLGMNSGSAPLHVAAMLAGFGPGDEVIAPPFTFVASVWGIVYAGARPVFADIEEGTFNLDPRRFEAAITPRTKGVVVAHLFGQPARMDEIMAIARRHRLFVIEDCAQAVGASYRGTPVGIIGDCGTFSFYPTKNLGACGEAGALVTREESLFVKARHIRVHGSDRRYYHDIVGGNFRMDGFQGAVLNVKLPHLADWTARRRAIAARYLSGIRLADVRFPDQPDYGQSVFHQFTLRHPRRDALREHLAKQEIGTDLIYPGAAASAEVLRRPRLRRRFVSGRGGRLRHLPQPADLLLELTDAQVDRVIAGVNSF